ncbi:MAG TPA: hypothetical protein VF988_11380 [Verrucomicrobiae bacterium]
MPFSDILLTQLPFRLAELIVAFGVIFVVALRAATVPDSGLMNFVRHRHRAWFAVGLFLLPMFVSRSFSWWSLQRLPVTNGGFEYQWLIALLLNLVYGIALGLVGCLLAATENREEKFKVGWAAGIAFAVICLMTGLQLLMRGFGGYRNFYITDIFAALIFVTFVIARVSSRKPPTAPSEAGEMNRKGSPALALTLGFLPSAMLLLLLPMVQHGNPSAALLIACCVISVICCFTASFLLFRRGTGLAIFGGILFICLNAFVSFLFGCGAMLTGMKF